MQIRCHSCFKFTANNEHYKSPRSYMSRNNIHLQVQYSLVQLHATLANWLANGKNSFVPCQLQFRYNVPNWFKPSPSIRDLKSKCTPNYNGLKIVIWTTIIIIHTVYIFTWGFPKLMSLFIQTASSFHHIIHT
jgi:hypothetical protein